jgi:hypothetical protein
MCCTTDIDVEIATTRAVGLLGVEVDWRVSLDVVNERLRL